MARKNDDNHKLQTGGNNSTHRPYGAAGGTVGATVAVERRKVHSPSRNDVDVRRLFQRLHGPVDELRGGDRESLRDYLVLLHAPLVEHCARNFISSGEPIEDMVQEGYVGLIKAVDRFDPDKGVRFSTYACHLITGEIRHYLRDLGRLIHEPGWHFELRQRISRTGDQLAQQLGRPAEPEEIAIALNIEPRNVHDVLRNQQTLSVEYLDAESDRDGDDGPSSDWNQQLTSSSTTPGATEAQVEDQMLLGLALPKLRELEKRAITMFFFEDLSKTEIARRLDISVNHAAYLIKRGVDGLRQIIDASEDGNDADVLWRNNAAGQVRAAYLLALAWDQQGGAERRKSTPATPTRKRANRRSTRLVEKAPASIIPSSKTGVASFAEFALWLDEEAHRAARYAQEFAVLWLKIENWEEIVQSLDDDEKRQVMLAIQGQTRRCCRSTDKIASFASSELPGLHMLVLMPHTGQSGRITGERWRESCKTLSILPDDRKPTPALKTRFAFVVFPRDGSNSDDLFRAMGQQLVSAPA